MKKYLFILVSCAALMAGCKKGYMVEPAGDTTESPCKGHWYKDAKGKKVCCPNAFCAPGFHQPGPWGYQ